MFLENRKDSSGCVPSSARKRRKSGKSGNVQNVQNVDNQPPGPIDGHILLNVDDPGMLDGIECAPSVRPGNVRKGTHRAHITLPDRHIPRVTRWLPDHPYFPIRKSGVTLRGVSYQQSHLRGL